MPCNVCDSPGGAYTLLSSGEHIEDNNVYAPAQGGGITIIIFKVPYNVYDPSGGAYALLSSGEHIDDNNVYAPAPGEHKHYYFQSAQ